MYTAAFILIGYMSGSVLYARIFANLFGKGDIIEKSKDKNPGTSNAFKYGGFCCGVLTLIFDLAKGFFPVFLYINYCRHINSPALWLALVISAPVAGHAFSLFYKFRGGKGIACSFGCLLGLFPDLEPVLILAMSFILFSTVLRITPHYHRTLITYFLSLLLMFFLVGKIAIRIGFLLITGVVYARMLLSSEEKERMRLKLLWTR